MLGEVDQLARRVGELGVDVARMRQECNCKLEDVLFKCDGLQARVDSTAPQLLGAFTLGWWREIDLSNIVDIQAPEAGSWKCGLRPQFLVSSIWWFAW